MRLLASGRGLYGQEVTAPQGQPGRATPVPPAWPAVNTHLTPLYSASLAGYQGEGKFWEIHSSYNFLEVSGIFSFFFFFFKLTSSSSFCLCKSSKMTWSSSSSSLSLSLSEEYSSVSLRPCCWRLNGDRGRRTWQVTGEKYACLLPSSFRFTRFSQVYLIQHHCLHLISKKPRMINFTCLVLLHGSQSWNH